MIFGHSPQKLGENAECYPFTVLGQVVHNKLGILGACHLNAPRYNNVAKI
jgi:hypothetical protein